MLNLFVEIGHADFDVPLPADWLIRINPAVFRSLRLIYSHAEFCDFDNEFYSFDSTPVLESLVNLEHKVNLKSFSVSLPIFDEYQRAKERIALLAEFLKSQRNLEELEYCEEWTPKLLEVVIEELPKLNDLWADLLYDYDDKDEIIVRFLEELPLYNEDPDDFKINGKYIFMEDYSEDSEDYYSDEDTD